MIWNLTFIFALFLGCYLGYLLAKYFSKKSQLSASHNTLEENINAILASAQSQREIILNEALKTTKEQYETEASQLESDRQTIIRMNENFDLELNTKQSEIDKHEHSLNLLDEKLKKEEEEIINLQKKQENIIIEKNNISIQLEKQLETKAALSKETLLKEMEDNLVNTEKLGITKWLMDNLENIKNEAQKTARSSLDSVYLRYQPKFIWPKSSFVIQTQSKQLLQKYFSEESPLIPILTENTETSVGLLAINEEPPTMLKISGGAGVDKEIIRLTIEEMLAKEIFHPEKIKYIIERHKKQIDKLILSLGQEALKILGLKKSMDPQILKLIGALNYRTSHRQNQYYHSLEVARLAGMIADEIGVDSEIAKRAGILHDIGKVLDYKIEGSHAVISADYATRFGETETVVDTVLAHHDDKIVETPFAYILKAADALSGARPGARVDMEEGYNRRIDGISGVVHSFQNDGVTGSAIMHAGREVHVFVDNAKVKNSNISELAKNIAEKLEAEVEYPGQIRVTVIRRTEVTEVA
jgi:ribonuclease Y